MIVAIQDANILIDLHNAGLLDAYFRLGIETHTTDLVIGEVSQSVQDYIVLGQLRVASFSGVEMAALLTFKATQPKSLSLQDCSVLQWAMQRSAVLLTGDAKLRSRAESKGVQARGVLWLLDLMVEQAILDTATAISFLQRLMSTNPRLPAADCQHRLKTWAAGRGIPPKPLNN